MSINVNSVAIKSWEYDHEKKEMILLFSPINDGFNSFVAEGFYGYEVKYPKQPSAINCYVKDGDGRVVIQNDDPIGIAVDTADVMFTRIEIDGRQIIYASDEQISGALNSVYEKAEPEKREEINVVIQKAAAAMERRRGLL